MIHCRPMRPHSFSNLLFGVCLLICVLSEMAGVSQAQDSLPARPASAVQFKLLKAVSGSKLSKASGRAHIVDARNTFFIPADTKIIVLMEWEGPPGEHTFEGYWRNPQGKVMVVTDFKYQTRTDREMFAGTLELMASPAMTPGMWTLEARIDGEKLGKHTFEVKKATKPAVIEDTRAEFGTAELYEKLNASTAVVESHDDTGTLLRRGIGFQMAGQFLTAFQVIDGASSVRVVFPDGKTETISNLTGQNRWQDWAVLSVSTQLPELERSVSKAVVGERCATVDIDRAGGRNIVDASIMGIQQFPRQGTRLKIASTLHSASIGAPMLNSYGEVVGMVGGQVWPGAISVVMPDSRKPSYNLGYSGYVQAAINLGPQIGIPVELIPEKTAGSFSFSQLLAEGVSTPPVKWLAPISRNAIAKAIDKSPKWMMPVDESFEFNRTESAHVFLEWQPRVKQAFTTNLRVYNADNRKVVESEPMKVSLEPSVREYSTWTLNLKTLPADTYRVDVTMANEVIWRSYFRVVE